MLFLRPCTEDDIAQAAQLMCTVYHTAPWNEIWEPERAYRRVTSMLSGISAKGYAMIVGTEIIGFLFGRTDYAHTGKVFYVELMYVHPSYQRTGCGSMALTQLEAELKKLMVNRIEYHVDPQDIAFYEKNGFGASSHIYIEKDI